MTAVTTDTPISELTAATAASLIEASRWRRLTLCELMAVAIERNIPIDEQIFQVTFEEANSNG